MPFLDHIRDRYFLELNPIEPRSGSTQSSILLIVSIIHGGILPGPLQEGCHLCILPLFSMRHPTNPRGKPLRKWNAEVANEGCEDKVIEWWYICGMRSKLRDIEIRNAAKAAPNSTSLVSNFKCE